MPAIAVAPEASTSPCRRTVVLVCGSSALLMFNTTAPTVALPGAAHELGAGAAAVQWVLASYALLHAGTLPAGGALGDAFGRRRLLVTGLWVFAVGSVLCAAAPTLGTLALGRVVQGLGAAGLLPAGLAMLGESCRDRDRARAVGTWAASIAAAVVVGPLLGGALVQTLGWRSPFAVAAVLAAALATGTRGLVESRVPTGRMDWAGTALLTTAAVLGVLVLGCADGQGWGSPPVLLGAGAVAVLLGAFAVVERRVAHPLIAPGLLRDPGVLAATGVAVSFAGCFATLTFLTLYLMEATGSGPLSTGVQVAPFALAAAAAAMGAARVAARIGTRWTLLVGLALCATGLAVLRTDGTQGPAGVLVPGLLLFGLGAGLVNAATTVLALGTVHPSMGGMATGVNNAAHHLGVAAALAGFGTLVQVVLTTDVRGALVASGTAPHVADLAARLAADGDPARAAEVAGMPVALLSEISGRAHGIAIDLVLGLGATVAVVGAVLVTVLGLLAPAAGRPPARDVHRADRSRSVNT